MVSLSHSNNHVTVVDIPEEGGDVFSSFDQETAPAPEEGRKGAFEVFDASVVWGGSGDPPPRGSVKAPDSFDGFSGNADDPQGDIIAELDGLNVAPPPDSGSEGKRRRKKLPKERKEEKLRRPSSLKGLQSEGI